MREILFRGKSKDNDVWVEGYYCGKVNKTIFSPAEDSAQIVDKDLYWHEVIPETVGQYTGLKDRKGTDIFEGDIVNIIGGDEKGIVRWHTNDAVFVIAHSRFEMTFFNDLWGDGVEAIGNIYDNPELLKGEG